MSTSSPLVFHPRTSDAVDQAVTLTVGSIVVCAICVLVFGFGVYVVAAGIGPAVFFVVSGGPRAYEVHADRLVIRYALRRDALAYGQGMVLQRLPHEMVLIFDGKSVHIDGESFAEGDFEKLGDALQHIASKTMVIGPRTPLLRGAK